MNLLCNIEGCSYLAERNGTCSRHNRESRKTAAPKTKPRKTRIAKQSAEGKERAAIYNGIRNMYLLYMESSCPLCLAEGKIETAYDIHHQKGRLGDNLYDVRYFLLVCRRHHQYIETHPEEAYEKGWSLLRTANEEHTI